MSSGRSLNKFKYLSSAERFNKFCSLLDLIKKRPSAVNRPIKLPIWVVLYTSCKSLCEMLNILVSVSACN